MKITPFHMFLAFFALIPAIAGAETIYLKDGTSITGTIKSVGTETVVIETSVGEMSVESAKISKLDRTSKVAPGKTNGEWRIQQNNGLGFGLGIASMPGITLFYDHNLSATSQWHTQLDMNAMKHSSLFGGQTIDTRRNMLLTTYRYFFNDNSGFYVGAGGGYSSSEFEYNNSSYYATPYRYTSKASGVFLLGEIGWQGIQGYYFHVGLQPAAYISSSDNFDINNVPDVSNHRSVANDDHDAMKKLSQISLGFGWFF